MPPNFTGMFNIWQLLIDIDRGTASARVIFLFECCLGGRGYQKSEHGRQLLHFEYLA
jgi:hypothetical protein